MRRFFSIIALAAAALGSTVGSAHGAEREVSHEGRTYRYTSTDLGQGRRLIEGRRLHGGQPFRLVVRGTQVSGTVGQVPVGFKVPAARADVLTPVETAAN